MAAPPPIGIKVEGLNQVVRALTEIGFETQDLKAAFGRISAAALPVYASKTPRDTGRLAADYRASKTKNRALLRVGRAAVPYAWVQQWGWPKRNIRAHHFVQEGDRVMEPRVIKLLEQEINQIIKRKGLS